MILKWWNRLSKLPLGRYFFSWAFWAAIPYSGSVRPEIVELERGSAKVRMRDRRFHRNHLKSLHAIAIANLAECASGLSLVPGLPEDAKGRGLLEANSHCSPPANSTQTDLVVESIVTNRKQEIVAKAKATWRIGAKKK
jgi:acyl-coenzyme A thioesterase PaaI-like protein